MTDYRYAGFWCRLTAFFVDFTLLCCVSLILLFSGWIAFILGSPAGGRALVQHMKQLAPLCILIYYLTLIFLNMLYFTYFHGNTGQTPGKMLLGIRVVRVDGEPMTYGIAFLRWTGYIISKLFLWFGFIWIGVDRRKRGWHDYIAGTMVVRVAYDADCEKTETASRDAWNASAVEAHGS